jgi:hypothetical protein
LLASPRVEDFDVGCAMIADTKNRSLVSVDISRHKK